MSTWNPPSNVTLTSTKCSKFLHNHNLLHRWSACRVLLPTPTDKFPHPIGQSHLPCFAGLLWSTSIRNLLQHPQISLHPAERYRASEDFQCDHPEREHVSFFGNHRRPHAICIGRGVYQFWSQPPARPTVGWTVIEAIRTTTSGVQAVVGQTDALVLADEDVALLPESQHDCTIGDRMERDGNGGEIGK